MRTAAVRSAINFWVPWLSCAMSLFLLGWWWVKFDSPPAHVVDHMRTTNARLATLAGQVESANVRLFRIESHVMERDE